MLTVPAVGFSNNVVQSDEGVQSLRKQEARLVLVERAQPQLSRHDLQSRETVSNNVLCKPCWQPKDTLASSRGIHYCRYLIN